MTLTEARQRAHGADAARSRPAGERRLYDIENINIVHHVNQALKAHKLFQKDRDYIVKDDKVVIIDEFTGRMMEGRRYSEGLHQALEAKEHVAIQPENVTLASITFQNYFRLYKKIAFLPIGDLFTMGPDEAAKGCELLGVKQVVPMHFGTFPFLTGTPARFASWSSRRACRCSELKPGETAS